MPRILLEGDTFEFIPDRKKLDESTVSGRRLPLAIPGRFSVCDTVNGNNRIYPRPVWEKNLREGSALQAAIAKGRSIGLLEHPKDGVVTLNSPISHLVTRAGFSESGQDVEGDITLLNTPEGHKMMALIEGGYIPLVSSRGFGSVEQNEKGVDVVQDDYVCESWDLVFNPSFKVAELDTNAVRVHAAKVEAVDQKPTVDPKPVEKPAPKPTVESTPQEELKQPAPPAQHVTQTPDQNMDIKTIRESASTLRNIDVSKLDPRRLAEGFTQMHALNREAAALKAADPKLSWDVDRLHEELKQLEEAWTTAAQAPASAVTRLQDQNARTTKILRETCVLGIKYRTALSEAEKRYEHKVKVIEEVARRGNGWRERALKAESAGKLRERRLNLAYASLDEFVKRYHADTTALAKHALMLEHKAKIEADVALLKRVNEATRVTELNTIKEELTKKPEAAKPAEAKPAAVTVESMVRPFTVAESVAATQRLSAASAAING